MKKFGKICLIGSCILFICGAVLTITGLAMGAANHMDQWSVRYGSKYINNENQQMEELGQLEGTYEEIHSISFHIPFGNVSVTYGDTFSIQAYNVPKEFKSFVVNGTWHVKDERIKNKWFYTNSNNEYSEAIIDITIPQNTMLKEFDLKIGLGEGEVEDINALKVDLEVGAGSMTVNQVIASQFTVECGNGDILINNANVKSVDLECGMGTINFTGKIQEDSDITCGMGIIDMLLLQSEKDFNYKLECAMGNLSVGNSDYSGIGKEKEVQNGADKLLDVECGMGVVTLDFEENK